MSPEDILLREVSPSQKNRYRIRVPTGTGVIENRAGGWSGGQGRGEGVSGS